MESDLFLDYDAFLRSIKQNVDIPHSFLIGAGASISSGILSANDCIWEWKKDIYLSKNANAPDFYKNVKNESVRLSIQNWLDRDGHYPLKNSEEEYSYYAEKAYPIADDRRKFFQNLSEGCDPYIGYKLLCLLNKEGIVPCVWTTNFDGLLVRAAHQSNLTPIEITLDNVEKIFRNQSRKELLSIALHGDYKYQSLKNIGTELDTQSDVFTAHLSRYLTDKNLIVIGYSGRDKSLMKALLSAYSTKGSGRLYWCGYGNEISDSVENLLQIARINDRVAYFISTDGFDKTIINISKACFELNESAFTEVKTILSSSQTSKKVSTPFAFPKQQTDKYLQSNLHPIVFPVEIFQFKFEYGDEKPWATLNKLTNNTTVCAVPFKKMVFALGSLSDIDKIFGSGIKGEITRVPISKNDIKKVPAFTSLMLKAIVKLFSMKADISSNQKDKLWLNSAFDSKDVGDHTIGIHQAVYLSLFFDDHAKYGFLTLKPTVHLISEKPIFKEEKQLISKRALEKLFNDKYFQVLENWNKILFNCSNIADEYPLNSGTGFRFKISYKTAFTEIAVNDRNFKRYIPKYYDDKQTQFHGVQFLEPQLIFTHNNSSNPTKDFHPMRALVNHRPYDCLLNGKVFSNEINIGVVCSVRYAEKLYKFLCELNQRHAA